VVHSFKEVTIINNAHCLRKSAHRLDATCHWDACNLLSLLCGCWKCWIAWANGWAPCKCNQLLELWTTRGLQGPDKLLKRADGALALGVPWLCQECHTIVAIFYVFATHRSWQHSCRGSFLWWMLLPAAESRLGGYPKAWACEIESACTPVHFCVCTKHILNRICPIAAHL